MVQPVPPTEEDGDPSYHHADSQPSISVRIFFYITETLSTRCLAFLKFKNSSLCVDGKSTSSFPLRFLTTVQQKVEAVREEMVRFYPDSTAQEWIEEHVSPVVAPLQRITEDIRACVKEMVP